VCLEALERVLFVYVFEEPHQLRAFFRFLWFAEVCVFFYFSLRQYCTARNGQQRRFIHSEEDQRRPVLRPGEAGVTVAETLLCGGLQLNGHPLHQIAPPPHHSLIHMRLRA